MPVRKAGQNAQSQQRANFTARVSRGPVDAPGKRHRKAPPQESMNRMLGEPTGKQMGQKNVKNAKGRGRG